MLEKLNCYVTRVSIFLITAALIAGMAGCDGGRRIPCPTPPPSKNLEIWTWYDLNATRDNLAGNHTLMNDLDSTTPGYAELASPTANGGKGWEPIGTFIPECAYGGLKGTFDGQGYEIHDLYINRPDEYLVGLFGCIYEAGVIKDIGVVNVTVIGKNWVGSLVGRNIRGTVSNSYAIGNVSANSSVGGLVGYNQGPVSNCYAIGNVVAGGVVGNANAVIGGFGVGGLVGLHEEGSVSSCYFTGNVTSYLSCVAWESLAGVGSLVGVSYATVNNSYSNANVTGKDGVGGLVGRNLFYSAISNSYFTGSVTGNSSVGGLAGESLMGTVSNCYSTGSVTGNESVGGLVGDNEEGTVSNSFWDVQTSGQATSDGGTGKNTTEMQDIATFSGASWNITAVALNETNPAYIWNIVNNVTYPFLSWQP
jgi:hypothetical protein